MHGYFCMTLFSHSFNNSGIKSVRSMRSAQGHTHRIVILLLILVNFVCSLQHFLNSRKDPKKRGVGKWENPDQYGAARLEEEDDISTYHKIIRICHVIGRLDEI
jgi:hypothetical protein